MKRKLIAVLLAATMAVSLAVREQIPVRQEKKAASRTR